MPVIWRDAVPSDKAEIERLWREQEEKFRAAAPTVKSSMPELFYGEEESDKPFWPFKPPILRVRVEEREGKLMSCRIVEAVCEVQVIGGDKETVGSLSRELPEECQWARARGFRSGWGLAPREFAKPIERSLRHTPLRVWSNLVLIGCDFSEIGD